MQLYLFLINVNISSLFRELYSGNSIYLSLQFGPYSVIKDKEGLNQNKAVILEELKGSVKSRVLNIIIMIAR